MYQKIKQFLDSRYLGWVIVDSIPKSKLPALMSRLHIEYKGIRINSLTHEELAYGLAEEAWKNAELAEPLIKILNEMVFETISKVSRMSENDVKLLIAKPGNIILFKTVGNFIWALLVDSRESINKLIPEFLKAAEDYLDKQESLASQKEKKFNDAPSKSLLRKTHKNMLNYIVSLEKEVDRERKISKDFIRINGHLNKKISEQQKINNELRKLNGELTSEKGVWHKQIGKKEREWENLNLRFNELKNQLAVGPKMRLKSEIHKLEKENASLEYTLRKEQEHNSGKVSLLEKEKLRLMQENKAWESSNSEILRELDRKKQEYAQLQKDYQSAISPKEQSVPKEKGRRLGIFIDNQNVYYSTRGYFGKKLDYQKLLELLVKDRHLVKAVCYIVEQPEVDQEGFKNILKNCGIAVRERELIRRADGSAKGNWDIGIAVDVLTMVEKNSLDIVVLVTCDGDFVDLIKLLSAKGIRAEVAGFAMNMAMSLKETADEYYFITQDCMLA
ncbi:MAG: NYN domain-containing protein [bacterium]